MGLVDSSLIYKDDILIQSHYSNIPVFQFLEPFNNEIRPEMVGVYNACHLLELRGIQIIFKFFFTADGNDVDALTEILQAGDDIREYFSAGFLFVRRLC